jgi:hypothetical protein
MFALRRETKNLCGRVICPISSQDAALLGDGTEISG